MIKSAWAQATERAAHELDISADLCGDEHDPHAQFCRNLARQLRSMLPDPNWLKNERRGIKLEVENALLDQLDSGQIEDVRLAEIVERHDAEVRLDERRKPWCTCIGKVETCSRCVQLAREASRESGK